MTALTMLHLLLLASTAAAMNSELPLSFGGFTFSRLAQPDLGVAPGPLQITDNVVTLQRAEAASLSSVYIEAMRREGLRLAEMDSLAVNGTANLQTVWGGQVFLAPISVGGQSFQVVIDSGSSDSWLATAGYGCYDVDTGAATLQGSCNFGSVYNPSQSSTYAPITTENFNISYADGEKLAGGMGYDSMTMAGITVPRQQFGMVNHAAWSGDGFSSGLVGFAYSSLTSAYAGTDPTKDQSGSTLPYYPLFVNMYQTSGVAPVFSLAINRDLNNAGLLALGGVPNIPHSPYYVSTPIQPVGVNTSDGSTVYEFYTISIDGFAYSASTGTVFNSYNNANPRKVPLVGNATNVIVDSGTSLIYAPDDIAAGVAAVFTPPGSYDTTLRAYAVACNARAPTFGIGVAKKIFYVNSVDMIIQLDATTCISGVVPNHNGLTIVGGVWLKNVVAVFDIGAQMMRFAARQYYGLTSQSVRAST